LSEFQLIAETADEIRSHSPEIFVVEFPKNRQLAMELLSGLSQFFPCVPIIGAGDPFDSQFLIDAMRLGLKEVLPNPLVSERVSEAFARIRRILFDAEEEKEPAKIISFFSANGGSGSTTITTNFAVSLSKISKQKVLVLDLDLELGEVANFFGIRSNKFLIQESEANGFLDPSVIARSIVTHSKSGVDVLSISDGLSAISASLGAEIKQLLALLQREYDYIVIDTSGILSDPVVAALDVSHLIFLVSKCSLPSLRNSQKVLHGFQRLGYSRNRVRVLINRYAKGEDISVREIEKALSFSVFWCIPNDFKSMIRAIQSGDPLTTHSQSTALAKSFYEMSAQILGIKVEEQPRPPKGGLLVRVNESSTKTLPLTSLNLLKS
ncbi:MAG TPA: AAA family ATPase, partial [Candidatus Hodarchaeales archaeon]|nr:AAA family ATPase [Candidatus Hodarchaeales archaeon]